MIQRALVISFIIMDKCGIVEWSTNSFKGTFSPFCNFARVIGFHVDVFVDASSLLLCRYNCKYQRDILFVLSYLSCRKYDWNNGCGSRLWLFCNLLHIFLSRLIFEKIVKFCKRRVWSRCLKICIMRML
jgi:hypothetical protein